MLRYYKNYLKKTLPSDFGDGGMVWDGNEEEDRAPQNIYLEGSLQENLEDGIVKDWLIVGLSIRYSIGPSVALSGPFCARLSCRVYSCFPVVDQARWIFWMSQIFRVEGIYRLKRSLEEEVGSFSLELVSKAAHK
jgi:hypothetical protein